MNDEKEGILRMIKALAFLFFLFAIGSLVLTYSFLQEPIVIPGWEKFSPHYPSKSEFFYYFLAGIIVIFLVYSWSSRLLKRFPNRSDQRSEKVFSFLVQTSEVKYWGSVWNAGTFLGLNLLTLGVILKIWQINNPAMDTFSIGFTATILISFVVILLAFVYPFLMIIRSNKQNGNG
jgi:ABC-type phosphate/phosphonate transport system permease subunit